MKMFFVAGNPNLETKWNDSRKAQTSKNIKTKLSQFLKITEGNDAIMPVKV